MVISHGLLSHCACIVSLKLPSEVHCHFAAEETKAQAPTIISSRSSCGAQYQVFPFVILEVTVADWMKMLLYPSLPFRL